MSCFAFLAAAGPSGPPTAFAKAAGKGASGKKGSSQAKGTPEFGKGKGEKGGGPKGQGSQARAPRSSEKGKAKRVVDPKAKERPPLEKA